MKRWMIYALALVLALGLACGCAFAAGPLQNIMPCLAFDPEWDYVSEFSDGYAKVEFKDGREGYINPYGEFNETKPATPYDMSAFSVRAELKAVNKGNHYYFMAYNNVLLEKLEEAHDFSQGVTAVKRNGIWFVIDAKTILQHAQMQDSAGKAVQSEQEPIATPTAEPTAEPTPEPTAAPEINPFEHIYLKKGSRGEEVRLVQQCLINMGYLGGSADGIYGNNTANAVAAYQRNQGYAETGEVDGELYREFFDYMNADERAEADTTAADIKSNGKSAQASGSSGTGNSGNLKKPNQNAPSATEAPCAPLPPISIENEAAPSLPEPAQKPASSGSSASSGSIESSIVYEAEIEDP